MSMKKLIIESVLSESDDPDYEGFHPHGNWGEYKNKEVFLKRSGFKEVKKGYWYSEKAKIWVHTWEKGFIRVYEDTTLYRPATFGQHWLKQLQLFKGATVLGYLPIRDNRPPTQKYKALQARPLETFRELPHGVDQFPEGLLNKIPEKIRNVIVSYGPAQSGSTKPSDFLFGTTTKISEKGCDVIASKFGKFVTCALVGSYKSGDRDVYVYGVASAL